MLTSVVFFCTVGSVSFSTVQHYGSEATRWTR